MPDYLSDIDVPYSTKVGGLARVWQEADATLTRPSNGTAYAVHKGLGSGASCLFTFSSFFRKKGGSGILTGARLIASGSSIATTNMGATRVHLFNSATISGLPASDQASFLTKVADKAIAQGFLDVVSFSIGDTGSDLVEGFANPTISNMQIAAASTGQNLYAVLEAAAAFTPLSAMVLALQLSMVED